jgi:type II secretory pathway pseudopilin PulG
MNRVIDFREEGAFTMIEVVVVLAIVIVVGIATTLSFQGAKNSADLTATAQRMTSLVRQAEVSAVAQKQNTAWGVYFSNTTSPAPFYALISSSTYSSSDVVAEYPLPSDIAFSTSTLPVGSSMVMAFAPLTGTSIASTSLSIYSTENPLLIANIVVAGAGQITYNVCNGQSGQWAATNSLPTSTYGQPAVVYNGYVYSIGGLNSGNNPTSTVYRAQVNPNGTLGSWTATTPLPVGTYDQPAVAYNGYIYSIAGDTYSNPTSTVYRAQVNPNGTLGSWTATTPLPVGTIDQPAVVYNGYIYSIGGSENVDGVTSTVYYAQLNPNGTLGSWTATVPLPNSYGGTDGQPAVAYNGYIYSIGGAVAFSTNPTSSVYRAQVNPNGTLGSWTATTPLPAGTYDQPAVAYNGYIYSIGGGYSVSATSSVYYASINSSGGLGAWNSDASLPNVLYYQPAIAYGGYLYTIGGFASNQAGGITSTVLYSSVCPSASF